MGVAKATVHRLAGELVEWGGLLERAGTKYRLGLRLFELGQLVPRQRILRDAALPYMEDLLLATQETVHFAVRDGIDVLYIEKIIGHRGLNQQSRVAGRLPLYCTATGKIILAFSPQSVFDEVVEQGFTALTSRTTMSVSVLRQQTERMRKEQLAVEVEETRLGYMSVAVPVFSGPRTLAGALSVTAPTARLNVSRITGGPAHCRRRNHPKTSCHEVHTFAERPAGSAHDLQSGDVFVQRLRQVARRGLSPGAEHALLAVPGVWADAPLT